jgi:DNA-binding NarL/FixJ family response regulator
MISRQPDIILLDINIIGERDGIQLAEIIREKIKKPFIYITSYTDRKTLERAKHTLPYGYIVKPFSESELKITIEIAIFRFQNEMDRAIPSREKINAILFQGLTEKEHDIMKDLYDGLANAQIASKHYISINTVKSHVKSIYNKISVHNRTELVKWLAGLK